jgi:hypothetical protein
MRVLGALVFAAFTSFAGPTAAQEDTLTAAAADRELREICADDRGRLWGVSLCGPLLVANPATRAVWASQPDDAGLLRPSGAGWVGTLPAGVSIANSAVSWGGRRWIMVMAPLPSDERERRVLLAHEAWHLRQDEIGLPSQPSDAVHLEQEQARVLLRLEFRALSSALRSRGRARQNAAREALMFRAARLAAFPGATAQEAALDRHEGLAAYTGARLGADSTADLYAARTLDAYDNHDAYARSYAYASGPAYGRLLDRLRRNWRRRLGEQTPADILAARLNPRFGDAALLAEASARYGGGAIAAEEAARALAQRERIAAARAAYDTGPRLALPLRAMQMDFDPNRIMPVEGLGSVYEVLTLRDNWGELRATEGALINSTFTEVIVPAPDETGLAGPGWRLELLPSYQLTEPGPDGRWTVETAPEAVPPG